MIKGGLSSFNNKRVLLLQGPLGPFFKHFSIDLEAAGAQVYKVNFNGGDLLFYPRNAINYRGKMSDWPEFLEKVLLKYEIDLVLLFGDCRPVHKSARVMAKFHDIELGVFEEGYVRPDYITLERSGVNAHSELSKNPQFYQDLPPIDVPETLKTLPSLWHAVLWTVLYSWGCMFLLPFFILYKHHRSFFPWQGSYWIWSAFRKVRYSIKERHRQKELVEKYDKHFYLLPLQVHNDAQIHQHSDFPTVESFLRYVVASFKEHAPKDTILVIKHHPLDRGHRDYTRLINRLAKRFDIRQRLIYIHDQHLPTLLNHTKGVVVLNSTVGLSALHHNANVIACGNALYDMPGLTYQGKLDHFWNETVARPVDKDLLRQFTQYIIDKTQINGNFYRRLKLPESKAGLVLGVAGSSLESEGDLDRRLTMPANTLKKAPVIELKKRAG